LCAPAGTRVRALRQIAVPTAAAAGAGQHARLFRARAGRLAGPATCCSTRQAAPGRDMPRRAAWRCGPRLCGGSRRTAALLLPPVQSCGAALPAAAAWRRENPAGIAAANAGGTLPARPSQPAPSRPLSAQPRHCRPVTCPPRICAPIAIGSWSSAAVSRSRPVRAVESVLFESVADAPGLADLFRSAVLDRAYRRWRIQMARY
jgi:hypothetical protein